MMELLVPIVIHKCGQRMLTILCLMHLHTHPEVLLPVPFRGGKIWRLSCRPLWHVGKVLCRKNGPLVQSWIPYWEGSCEMTWTTGYRQTRLWHILSPMSRIHALSAWFVCFSKHLLRMGWYQLACSRQWWTSFLDALSTLDKCWPIAKLLFQKS